MEQNPVGLHRYRKEKKKTTHSKTRLFSFFEKLSPNTNTIIKIIHQVHRHETELHGPAGAALLQQMGLVM